MEIKIRIQNNNKILKVLNPNDSLSKIRLELIDTISFPFIFKDSDENDISKEKEPEIILKDILDGKNLYLGKEVINRVMLGKKLNSRNGLDFYEYPQKILTKEEKDASTNILVIGATGTGKSAWINSLINYLQDIQLEEKGRYFLLDENRNNRYYEKNEPLVYNIEPTKLFMNPIRLIDTPGFGDVRGIKYDTKLIDDLKNLFQGPDINNVNAICIFFSALQSRVAYPLHILNCISLFDKEIKNNIIFIFTFADNFKNIPALETIKYQKNSFHQILGDIEQCPYFAFQNNVYYSNNRALVEYFYEGNNKSFRNLLKYIISLKRVSLK